MTLLIDTNILIDIFLKREPFFDDSYRALRRAIEQGVDCCVSASAATDLLYILRKNLQSKEQAKQYLYSVKQLARFADVQESDIETALSSEMPDFEDAVLDAVADRCLVHFDTKHQGFCRFKSPVYLSHRLLKAISPLLSMTPFPCMREGRHAS